MAVSDEQYQALLNRVAALEQTVSNLLIASQHYATVNQVAQLLMLTETRLDDLEGRTTGLENQLKLILDDPNY